MKLLVLFLSCASLWAGECVAVNSNKIFARDLIDGVPAFNGVDPETVGGFVVGFAPLPGVQRILSSRELQGVAQRAGLTLDGPIPAVCIERSLHLFEPSDLRRVLLAALEVVDASLEIVDYSKTPVPAGRFDFPITGLNKPPPDAPETAVVWRGRLIYDGDRSMAVWAKVRITVERPTVVATGPIAAGATIRAEQVKTIRLAQFPLAESAPEASADVVGKTARRTIRAGERISAGYLDITRDIAAGDRVRVSVVDGLAVLSLAAIAQSGGSKGESVTVRNPASGKTFRGTVEGRGKVVVRSSEELE